MFNRSAFLVFAVLAACATPGKDTAIGAGGGAAAGAVVGGVVGGWKGAAIGAGAGALVGGSIGNYLDKQAQELKEVAETKRTRDGILVNLKSELLFQTGSAILKEDAISQLERLGDILAKYPEDRIRIEGYTDSTGTDEINNKLSRERAATVVEFLQSQGIAGARMTSEGYGSKFPVASNDTKEGKAKNRRVEIVLAEGTIAAPSR